jgi:NodT family efflux transporter outer membrane factor (OMF) lipoprotein
MNFGFTTMKNYPGSHPERSEASTASRKESTDPYSLNHAVWSKGILPRNLRGGTHKASLVACAFLTAALLLLTLGCAVGPHYHKPSATVPAAPNYKESPVNFQDAEGWKVASPQDAMLHGNWWEIFNQPELNDLEAQLNINNQNIRVFFENYLAARAIIRQARAQYYPSATVGATALRSHSSGGLSKGTSGTGGSSGATITEFTLPVDISWAPDLFGRIRNTVREFQANAQVSAADLENERLLEQATLAETYFEIRGQDALQQVLDSTVKADEELVELAQTRYEVGTDTEVSVQQAIQTLESARAAATNVGILRAQYEHAIATLLGKAATDFSMPVKPLLVQPPAIPTGTPSQLLERRPDIAAAERLMASANAVIGIGYAAYYPTLSLSASGGFASSAISKLLNASSRTWSVGPSVSETIFDAGLRRATIEQYIAQYNADVATYRQTVLTAFQQVEDYLAQTRILWDEIRQEQAAVAAAQKAYDLEKARYETGLDPYLNLLTTQTALLATQETLVGSQVQQMSGAVLLVEALGGGWDVSQLPTTQQVTQRPPADQRTITK